MCSGRIQLLTHIYLGLGMKLKWPGGARPPRPGFLALQCCDTKLHLRDGPGPVAVLAVRPVGRVLEGAIRRFGHLTGPDGSDLEACLDHRTTAIRPHKIQGSGG